jgi:hypothetical protein
MMIQLFPRSIAPSSEEESWGCDRASAKDFREIREVFLLRAAAVPPSTAIEKESPFS